MTDLNQVQAEKLVELTINDLLVKLPVEKIKIAQDYKSQEALPLRSGSSFIVSGFGSSIRVNLPIIAQFGTESSRDIVTLYNYIRKMPFVFVKSQYLNDYMEKGIEGLLALKGDTIEKIAAENPDKLEKEVKGLSYEDRRIRAYNIVRERIFGRSPYMVFAVQQMNLSTIPGTSDGVRLTLDMEYSLYTPYVKDLLFRKKAMSPADYATYEKEWVKVSETWHMNNLTKEDYFLHRYRIEKGNGQVTQDLSESDVFRYLYSGSKDNPAEINIETGELIESEMPFLTGVSNSDLEFEIVDHSAGGEGTVLGSIHLPDSATTFVAINHAFQFSSIVLQGMPYPSHQYLGLGQSTCMAGFVSRGSDDSNNLNSVVNFYNIFQSMSPKVQEKTASGEPRLTLPKIRVKNEFLNQMGISNIVFNGQVKETIVGTSDGEQFVVSFIDASKSNPNIFIPKRNRFTSKNYAFLNTARKLLADKIDKLKGKSVVFNIDIYRLVASISSEINSGLGEDKILGYKGTTAGVPIKKDKQDGFISIDELDMWLGLFSRDAIQNEETSDIIKIDKSVLTLEEAELKELFDMCLKAAKTMTDNGITNPTIDNFTRSFILSTGQSFATKEDSYKVTKTANPKQVSNFIKYADNANQEKSEFKTVILPVLIAIKLLELLVGKAELDKDKTRFIVGVNEVVSVPSQSTGIVNVGGIPLTPIMAKMIEDAANANGIDPNLLKAQVRQESRFKPKAVSYAGAAGLIQLMPATARAAGLKVSDAAYNADAIRIQHMDRTPNRDRTKDAAILKAVEDATRANNFTDIDERFDPNKNLNASAKYLAGLIKKTGSQELGLAAYNAGPGNKSVVAGKIPQNGETNVYVDNILKFKAELERSQSGVYSPKVILDTHLTSVAYDAVINLLAVLTDKSILDITDIDLIDDMIHEAKVHGGYSYGDFDSRIHPYSEKLLNKKGIPDRSYMNPDEFIFNDSELYFFTETHLAGEDTGTKDPAMAGTSDSTLGLPIELFDQLQRMNATALNDYNYRKSPDLIDTQMMVDRKQNGQTDLMPRSETSANAKVARRAPLVSSAGAISNPTTTHNHTNTRAIASKNSGDTTESFPESDIDQNLATRLGKDGEAHVQKFDPTVPTDLVTDVKESSVKNYLKDNPGFRKAFPTFKIFFIEEDSMETDYRVLDDFYDTNGVLEISIVEEKDNPIQTAFIKLVNPAQKIVSPADLGEGGYVLSDQQKAEMFAQNSPYQSTDETSMEERFQNHFPLKENSKIMIYLGYDQDTNKLTKKFTGFVSQIDGGEVMSLTAHSYGAELVIDRSTEKRSVSRNGSEPYGVTVARSILSLPNILHFGRWQINDFQNWKMDSQEKLRTAIDAERDTVMKILKGSIFSAFTDPKLIRRALTTWGYFRAANYDENIFIPFVESIEKDTSVISLPNAHSWRILKEIEMKYPGIIVYPLPYENRMTMYIGPANGKYAFRDFNTAELMYAADKNKNKIHTLEGIVNSFLSSDNYTIDPNVTYLSTQLTSDQLEAQLVAPRVQLINSQTEGIKLQDGEVKSLMLVPGSADPIQPYLGAITEWIPGVDGATSQLSHSGMNSGVYRLKYELEELQVSQFGYATNLIELSAADPSSKPKQGAAIVLSYVDRYAEVKKVFLGINDKNEQKAKIAASVFMLVLMLLDDQFAINQASPNGRLSDSVSASFTNFMRGEGGKTNYADRFAKYSELSGKGANVIDDEFFFYSEQLDRLDTRWGGWLTVNEASAAVYYNLNRIMNMAISGNKYTGTTNARKYNETNGKADYEFSGPFPDYENRLKIFNDAVQVLMRSDLSNTRLFSYFIKLLVLIVAPNVDSKRISEGATEFRNDAPAEDGAAVETGKFLTGSVLVLSAAFLVSTPLLVAIAAASVVGTTGYQMYADSNNDVEDLFGNFDNELKQYIISWVTISELLDSNSPFETSLASSRLIINTRYKMFRQYHSAASAKNIIYNGIKHTEQNVFNAIGVDYNAGGWVTNKLGIKSKSYMDSTKILKFDQSLPDWKLKVYPYSTATEISSEDEAVRYASALLEKNINRSYDGPLILMGNPEIKPYDYIYLHDTYRGMYGFVDVRAVVHTLNRQGFITEVTPGLATSFYDTVSPSLLAGAAFNIANLFDANATGFEMDNDYKKRPNPKGLTDEQLKAEYSVDLKAEMARTLSWQQALLGGAFFAGATGLTTAVVVGSAATSVGTFIATGAALSSFGTFFLGAGLAVTAWYGACAFFLPEDDNRIPVAVHPLLQNNQPFIAEGFSPKSVSSMSAYKNKMVQRSIGLDYLIRDVINLPDEIKTSVGEYIVRAILKS